MVLTVGQGDIVDKNLYFGSPNGHYAIGFELQKSKTWILKIKVTFQSNVKQFLNSIIF